METAQYKSAIYYYYYLLKSANYDPGNIKFFHNLYIFALEINYFPVLLSVRASACKVTEA